MTLTLSDKEKKAIAAAVTERIDEYLSRFPFARYQTEPLEAWRRTFREPDTVPAETLRQAVCWQLGGWQRKDLALAHRKTVAAAVKAWPDFVQTAGAGPEEAFAFWQSKLPDWHNGFGAAAFLLHLQHPGDFENTDHHRLDTMIELLRVIDHSDQERTPALSITDLQDYTVFFRSLVSKLPYGKESAIKLDRFLKIYGNRHAYKHVDSNFITQEPLIRTFSWDTAISDKFCLERIVNRSNADLLFACCLLALEMENRSHVNLTVGEVIALLPLGTGGLCNPASFNYAMVALFGGQKQRDFWRFENPDLTHAFTEQANNSTRNMRFHLGHASEKIAVNPKYVKEPI